MLRVAQHARDLRLVDEHLDEVVVLGEVREHALDRDQVRLPVRVEGLGPVDLGHAAERDAIEQMVAAELLSPSHRQSTSVASVPRRRKGVHVLPACDRPEIRYHRRMSRRWSLPSSSPSPPAAKSAPEDQAGGEHRRRRPRAAATAQRPRRRWRRRRCRRGAERHAGRRPNGDDSELAADEGKLAIEAPGDAKAGAETTAKVIVTPATGVSSQQRVPDQADARDARGRDAREGRAQGRRPRQGARATPTRSRRSSSRSRVKLTPAASGSYTINGTFKFAVCDKDSASRRRSRSHPGRREVTRPAP